MAVIQGTILETGQQVDITVPTVKIPELPITLESVDDADKFPFWDNSQGKTLYVSGAKLRDYIATGGDGIPETPVLFSDRYEITITAAQAGTNRCDVPALAGDQFILERRGVGQYTQSEYSILPSGGFILNDGTLLAEGEIFFAHIFSLLSNITGPASILTGIAYIGSDTSIADAQYNKLCYVLNSAGSITVTLPDIATAPENLIIVVQTATNVTKQTKVTGRSGQVIYFDSGSKPYVWLGKSELIWFYRGSDGWYILSGGEGILGVGEFAFGYKEKRNTITMKGQLVNRADFPRLWEWVQTLGLSLVSEATWNTSATITDIHFSAKTVYPYHGCFSTGDGTNTFRLPDLQNQFIRGLANIGGTDTQRTFNNPGGAQGDETRQHSHYVPIPKTSTSTTDSGVGRIVTGADGNEPTDAITLIAGAVGGSETRGMNIGLLPLIKI